MFITLSSYPQISEALVPHQVIFLRTGTETFTEKSQQSCAAQSQSISLKTPPSPKAQRTSGKKRKEDSKSQRSREFDVRLCLLMPEATPIKYHQSDCLKVNWTSKNTIDIAKWEGDGL